jgi:hypothetical protein
MVRDSLEHAFLPGASLWVAPENFTMLPACSSERPEEKDPRSAACRNFLASSERARLQWKEEAEFNRFEAQF